jgi:hypothetical protein
MAKKKTPMAARGPSIPLSAVVYCEGGVWLAHCLELDIVADADSPTKAMEDVMELSMLQVTVAAKEGELDSVFRPAPPEIWKMFWMGTERTSPRKPEKPVNRFEMRELELV